jgi:predicted membrane protein
MRPEMMQKHLFCGTLLLLLFMGSLSSVFRADFEAKVVTVVCATILFGISVLHYALRNARLP